MALTGSSTSRRQTSEQEPTTSSGPNAPLGPALQVHPPSNFSITRGPTRASAIDVIPQLPLPDMQRSASGIGSGPPAAGPSSWQSAISPTDSFIGTRATATEHLDPGAVFDPASSALNAGPANDLHVQQHGDPGARCLLGCTDVQYRCRCSAWQRRTTWRICTIRS
jgi:hypothetical protein